MSGSRDGRHHRSVEEVRSTTRIEKRHGCEMVEEEELVVGRSWNRYVVSREDFCVYHSKVVRVAVVVVLLRVPVL